MSMTRRDLMALTASLPITTARAACDPSAHFWNDTQQAGRGQTVAFGAWAGDERANAFIAWVGERMQMQFGVRLRHRPWAIPAGAVRWEDTLDLVSLDRAGLATFDAAGLLDRSVLQRLPNARMVPTADADDAKVSLGAGASWRAERFVFVHDAARLADPPRSMMALLDWSAAHPGRFAHPPAREPVGAAFLTQALLELAPEPSALRRPATNAGFAAAAALLWEWYAALRPTLWRGGPGFATSLHDLRAAMFAGEIDLSMSLNPAEALTEWAHRTLPETVRAYRLGCGGIAPRSYLAIPAASAGTNARCRAAALLVADFMLSAEAQARLSDPLLLGSSPVLARDRLPAGGRDLPVDGAQASGPALPGALAEPHWSWRAWVVAEWERRFSAD